MRKISDTTCGGNIGIVCALGASNLVSAKMNNRQDLNDLLSEADLNSASGGIVFNGTQTKNIVTIIKKYKPVLNKKYTTDYKVVNQYFWAHYAKSVKLAMELARSKCCRACCPDGITLQVKILKGAELIWNSSLKDDGYGDVDILKNIKDRTCRVPA